MSKYISELRFIEFADFFFPPQLDVYKENKLDDGKKLFNGCIIYLMGDAVDFFSLLLPHFGNVRFKLISGLSDRVVPQSDNSRDVLNFPGLIAWFTPNIVEEHSKLYHIPLGIPRHLPILYHPTEENDKGISYMAWPKISVGLSDTMEQMYDSMHGGILDRMKAKINSDKLLFISYTTVNSDNCYLSENVGFRRKLDNYWLNTPFVKHPLMDWIKYIKLLSEHKFTIEPPGRCLDGYRVWEALYVGTIPIVFRSSISELHQDLPILVIDSFQDITRENLEEKYIKLLDKVHKWEKLDMQYWIKRIKDVE